MREVHMSKGKVGEDRGSKEMDGCPLTDTIFMYSNLVRVPQSILYGFPLIRQVLYLLFTFTYIFTLNSP
jgi:hypothetical protein